MEEEPPHEGLVSIGAGMVPMVTIWDDDGAWSVTEMGSDSDDDESFTFTEAMVVEWLRFRMAEFVLHTMDEWGNGTCSTAIAVFLSKWEELVPPGKRATRDMLTGKGVLLELLTGMSQGYYLSCWPLRMRGKFKSGLQPSWHALIGNPLARLMAGQHVLFWTNSINSGKMMSDFPAHMAMCPEQLEWFVCCSRFLMLVGMVAAEYAITEVIEGFGMATGKLASIVMLAGISAQPLHEYRQESSQHMPSYMCGDEIKRMMRKFAAEEKGGREVKD